MTRQVRLDDDVVALVEDRADGLSLSGATNLLLRALLGRPATIDASATRIAQDRAGRPGALIDHPDRPGSPQATTERLVEAKGPEPGAGSTPGERPGGHGLIDRADDLRPPGSTTARRAKRQPFRPRPLCTHPLELRVGLRCGICGRRFR